MSGIIEPIRKHPSTKKNDISLKMISNVSKTHRRSILTLICAIPYEGFERKWAANWQFLYREILAKADGQKIFSPKFTYAAFQIRNRWMVDHAVRLIAVYNGTPGGTRNTLAYAQKKSIALRIIPG